MRGPARPPESAEMVREVLLKLPTTDVARCRCVCRLWRGVVAEPTFSSLHAEAEANGNHVFAASEALLVTETREHGRPEEASFSIVSASTPAHMPHRITIPSGYSLSNVCNGLVCFTTCGRTSLGQRRNPDEMLMVDVATEAHRMCRLPIEAEEFHSACDPQVNVFEMSGRLCLAVKSGPKFQFWVVSLPPPDQWVEGDDSKLWWDLRYSFYDNDASSVISKKSAWFDDGTMCFRHGDALFTHDTKGRSLKPSPEADCPQCDRRLQLPPTPSNCKWNIVGGYRPSLLSPLTLAAPPSSCDGEEERQDFHHAMFLAVRRNE
uniref:F-box domain-containing protein n=1 Tax=Aegilops tauschii TaxID=37682 RepID=N1QYK4_AEGTA